MIRGLWVLVAMASLALPALPATVELHLFWATTCPDCHVMWEYLRGLAQEYPELVIVDHEVEFNPDNWRLMVTLAGAYGLKDPHTPTVIVGNLALSGVGLAVELQIREEVERCLQAGCPSPMERLPQELAWALSPLEITLILAVAVVFALIVWGR